MSCEPLLRAPGVSVGGNWEGDMSIVECELGYGSLGRGAWVSGCGAWGQHNVAVECLVVG